LNQFFVIYKDTDPWFPPIQHVKNQTVSLSTLTLNTAQQQKLKKAEEHEFIEKNYRSAISFYNDLLTNAMDKNEQAQLLIRIARNLIKLKKYNKAASVYSTISNEYPSSKTSSGSPLVIYARLQLMDCYINLGEYENALNEALDLYEKLLSNLWILAERQYRSFTSMVNETITSILQRNSIEILQKEIQIKN
jgi:tetratricopeptide (TPR) repeat protein